MAVPEHARHGQQARRLQQNDHKPKHRHKPLDALVKSKHFLLKAEDVQIDDVYSYNLGTRGGQPTASGGARNTSPSCVPDVTRRLDKIAKSMIIPLLHASSVNHDSIITAVAHTANAGGTTPTPESG